MVCSGPEHQFRRGGVRPGCRAGREPGQCIPGDLLPGGGPGLPDHHDPHGGGPAHPDRLPQGSGLLPVGHLQKVHRLRFLGQPPGRAYRAGGGVHPHPGGNRQCLQHHV